MNRTVNHLKLVLQVADDPETLRIKQNTKNISNVAYHGDIQKKAAMERQRELTEIVDNRGRNRLWCKSSKFHWLKLLHKRTFDFVQNLDSNPFIWEIRNSLNSVNLFPTHNFFCFIFLCRLWKMFHVTKICRNRNVSSSSLFRVNVSSFPCHQRKSPTKLYSPIVRFLNHVQLIIYDVYIASMLHLMTSSDGFLFSQIAEK